MADSALARLVSSARNPGGWVTSGLEQVQESTGPSRQDAGWFHPSSFGDECDARLAFAFLGAPSEQVISAKLQRIFDLGNARDLALKADMRRAGLSLITKESERKIEIPHLRIRGELDDWIQHPKTGNKYLLDYKTMNSDEWKSLTVAKYSHQLQVMPYEYAKETYEGFILYENKNDQSLKILTANFDGKVWQTTFVERTERILKGLQNNQVFRAPTSCNNCPYFKNTVCAANQIEKLKEVSGLF